MQATEPSCNCAEARALPDRISRICSNQRVTSSSAVVASVTACHDPTRVLSATFQSQTMSIDEEAPRMKYTVKPKSVNQASSSPKSMYMVHDALRAAVGFGEVAGTKKTGITANGIIAFVDRN